MPRKISLDHSTTPMLNPAETIRLAHELRCDGVVLRMSTYPGAEKTYSIIDDAELRRAIRNDLANTGMYLAMASPFEIKPGVKIADMAKALDGAADVGARGLNVVVYDTDKSVHEDKVGELAEEAGKRGLRTLIEFFALSGCDSLDYTVRLIQKLGHPMLGMNADSLHVTRTGATMAQLAAVPRGLIGHAQIDDGPLTLPREMQMDEARGERLLPGEGEFDLIGFVRALPEDVTIGVEAPTTSAFARGVTMEEHGRAAIEATRRVIAQALTV